LSGNVLPTAYKYICARSCHKWQICLIDDIFEHLNHCYMTMFLHQRILSKNCKNGGKSWLSWIPYQNSFKRWCFVWWNEDKSWCISNLLIQRDTLLKEINFNFNFNQIDEINLIKISILINEFEIDKFSYLFHHFRVMFFILKYLSNLSFALRFSVLFTVHRFICFTSGSGKLEKNMRF